MIPLMKSAFAREPETRKALSQFVLEAPRLSMGSQCFEFERCFAEYQGRQDAILFNSGGSANLALLQALKNLRRLADGDQVGFSALTWSTNVMPIIQLNMRPVPVDCDPSTVNTMSHNLLARLKETPLKSLFITNALGLTGDLSEIRSVCREREILLLEDNCEALGTELPAGKAGNFGVASTFSFFVAHHMSTIEGGMVCTDDVELAEMLRIVRANGWARNLPDAQESKWRNRCNIEDELSAKYTFYELGYNLRPTEITGFLGRLQLAHLPDSIRTRARNHHRLDETLTQNPDLRPLDHTHISLLSSFAYPVICDTQELRREYVSKFGAAGVEIRPLIAGNIQRQPFYQRYQPIQFDLPGTEFLHRCGFYFGNSPEITDSELDLLASCLREPSRAIAA